MTKTFSLEMIIPRSLTLCIISGCGSLYLFSFVVERSFSDDGRLSKTLIYEYSRVSFEVIL